jgi:hypothetical protein
MPDAVWELLLVVAGVAGCWYCLFSLLVLPFINVLVPPLVLPAGFILTGQGG